MNRMKRQEKMGLNKEPEWRKRDDQNNPQTKECVYADNTSFGSDHSSDNSKRTTTLSPRLMAQRLLAWEVCRV